MVVQLSASCQIYSTFAEGIRQIVIHNHEDLFLLKLAELLFNYLDDFFGGHPDPRVAQQQFRVFLKIIEELGIPTQPRKCHAPATMQVILGFLYDSILQRISIPAKKVQVILDRIDHLLHHLRSQHKISRRELARVTGVLMWASQVIFPAKAMLRRLQFYVDQDKFDWDTRWIRLPVSVQCDLIWWKHIIQSAYNGISFRYLLQTPQDADIHIWSDAADTDYLGCGAYSTYLDFYQLRWSDLKLTRKSQQLLQQDIVYKEFVALVLAVLLWGHKFTNRSVTFHCDNKAVVGIVIAKNCSYSRLDLMDLMRLLAETAFHHRFWFWIEHIDGTKNIEADKLSRFKRQPFKRLYQASFHKEPSLQPFFAKQPHFSSANRFTNWNATKSISQILNMLSVFRYSI